MESETQIPTRSGKLGVSIATILIATSLIAIAAAPYSWLGDNYAASAVVSMILLGLVCGVLACRLTLIALFPCALAVVSAAVLFSSGLFYQAVGTAVVCLATIGVPQWVRFRVGACVVAMLLAYIPTFQYARASDARIDRMRTAYPFASIRERLPDHLTTTSAEPAILSTEQDAILVEIDDQDTRWRSYVSQLEQIHDESYKQFIRTPNFGMLRMGPVTEDRIGRGYELTEGIPFKLPQRLSFEADNASPHELHKSTQKTFLDRERLGHVKDVNNVAGFIGHGFNRLPYDDRVSYEGARMGRWTLRRLDLIGFVTHHNPVAYVTEHLPNMEELDDAPTRELTKFEADALVQLRQEKDIVFEEQAEGDAKRIIMVGALRAGKSCAACHSVPYGTLLGAFSYELRQESVATSLHSDAKANSISDGLLQELGVTTRLQSHPSTAD